MPENSFTLPAFAKINLSLRVLGRRADGYHEIETVFQTVTLHDRLTFSALDGDHLELTCSAPDIPTDERNLVRRAAHALRERYGIKRGARIELEKRIPAEGGLGGGSSDAAVTLVALAHLWEVETGAGELARLGAHLGADVPFFLTGGRALGTGLGADIAPLADANKAHLVIATPGVRVSTAEAYRALSAPALTKAEVAAILHVSRADAQISDSLCDVLRNDFEPVIYTQHPEIERARNALLEHGAHAALLAGSGSSVFGIFDDGTATERVAQALEQTEPAWRVFAATTLSRDDYREFFGVRAAFLSG